MKEQEIPVGMGKLYVTTADDKNLEHLQEIKLHKTDFKNVSDDAGHHWNGNNKGFAITANLRFDSPKEQKQAHKLWKRLTEGEGRLPRKEKKRRISRITRNEEQFLYLILLTYYKPSAAENIVAASLFPERVGKDEESGMAVVCFKDSAQMRFSHTFTQYLLRNNFKLLKNIWTRARHHAAFNSILSRIEAHYAAIKQKE